MTENGSAPVGGQVVEEALHKAAAAIGAARTLLDQGNVVDLNGLEAHVDNACSAIPGLPQTERDRLKPALVALIDGLNGLNDKLTAQHKELASSLQGISNRRQAVSAYKPRGSR